jgi:hypothetical protein
LVTAQQVVNGNTGAGTFNGNVGLQAINGATGLQTTNGGCNTTTNGTFTLCNPLTVNNFCDLIKAILGVIMTIGVPIAVLFLVWAGFKFIFARGNEEQLRVAKKNFMFVIIGIAVFLGAWTLASIISATIQQLDKNHTIALCTGTSGQPAH